MFKHLLCFALLGVILLSCSKYNSVKVTKTNFEDEVLRTQNLVFTFNKTLISDSGLMNKWDTTQYIRFEPAIAGRFMWTEIGTYLFAGGCATTSNCIQSAFKQYFAEIFGNQVQCRR